jgi:hypothetical protein
VVRGSLARPLPYLVLLDFAKDNGIELGQDDPNKTRNAKINTATTYPSLDKSLLIRKKAPEVSAKMAQFCYSSSAQLLQSLVTLGDDHESTISSLVRYNLWKRYLFLLSSLR